MPEPQNAVAPAIASRRKWPLLLILPVLLVCAGFLLRSAKGPAYLAAHMEPEYAYLFNSLNLAEGKASYYPDHPGTTVQLAGAALLHLKHPLDSQARAEDTLKNPERHLSLLGTTLMLCAAGAMLISGLLVLSAFGSVGAALAFQAFPFFSPATLEYGLTRFSPEPLLLTFSLLISALLLSDKKNPLLLGILAACGLATKLTFAPLALLPFFTLNLKELRRYVAYTAGGFFLLTLPILHLYPEFIKWAGQLLFGKGIYGQHGFGLDAGSFTASLARIVNSELPYAALLLLLAALLFRAWRAGKSIFADTQHRLAFGLLVCGLAGLFFSAKLYSPRYLIPCACSGAAIAALFAARAEFLSLPPLTRAYRQFLAVLLSLFVLITLWNFTVGLKFASACRDSQLGFMNASQEAFAENPKIYFYPVSSQLMALFDGNIYAGANRGELLEKLYPLERTWFVHRFRPALWTWTAPADTQAILEQHHRQLIFLGNTKLCPEPLPGLMLMPLLQGEFCNNEAASAAF